jgi:hypothetical protein
MGCCGDRRKAAASARRMPAGMPQPTRLEASKRVPLVFLGSGTYLVSGPHSRTVYTFSTDGPEQLVEERDAPALVRTGLFRTPQIRSAPPRQRGALRPNEDS